MIEKLIVLEDIDPVLFYGVNNANMQLIKALYPKLRIVARGNVMKVIGEEGTSLDDFLVYLKSEFLDYVYLQQNTFDAVDGATSAERQRYMFDRIYKVLAGSFKLPDKDTARRYFLELRQLFMDWNYLPFNSEEFKKQEAGIEAKIAERSTVNA